MNKPAPARADGLLAALTPQNCRRAAIAFFVAMILIGSIPGEAEALNAMIYDKLSHFVAYSLLSGFVYHAFQGSPLRRALLTLASVGLFGATDEVVQSLLSYRQSSVLDWQVDMLAACVTVTVLWSIRAARVASGK